jgi:GAF domain-containing protein
MLARKTTGDISQLGWQSLLQNIDGMGYISLMNGEVTQVSDNLDTTTQRALLDGESVLSADNRTLSMPISVRGQLVATMRLVKPSASEPWMPEEIEDIKTLAAQLSNTLDSARLFREAQRRAVREQAIGEISAQISSASEVEAILQTAAEEIGRHLSEISGVSIEMNNLLD